MTSPNALTIQEVFSAAQAAAGGRSYIDALRVSRHAYIGELVFALSRAVDQKDKAIKLERSLHRGNGSLTIRIKGNLAHPLLTIRSRLNHDGDLQPTLIVIDHVGAKNLKLDFDERQTTFNVSQINDLWTLIDEAINPILVGDPNAWRKGPEKTADT